MHRPHCGDNIGLHDAFDRGNLLEDCRVGLHGGLAIELGDQLVVGENDDIGELAVAEFQRLQLVDGIGGIGRTQQFNEEVDVHHDLAPGVALRRRQANACGP